MLQQSAILCNKLLQIILNCTKLHQRQPKRGGCRNTGEHMITPKDPYASEAETQALLVPDTRMKAERKLAKMMAERGADEQGAEVYPILRQIAVELLAEQPAQQQEPVPDWDAWNACSRLNSALEAIGDFAHDKSTGPAVPDALWEIRAMAYAAIEALEEQPAQQEPVAAQSVMTVRIWRDKNSDQNAEFKNWHKLPDGEHILYTSPPAQQEPDAFVPREAIRTLSGGANHVPATLTLNDDGGKAVAVFLSPQPVQQDGLEMVDDEGENQAVRMFLALYGGQYGITAEQMRKHLKMAGFDGAWPDWASNHNGHLTKAGAQLWIRHLFALEQPAQQEPVARVFNKSISWRPCDIAGLPAGTPLYTSPPAQRKPLTLGQKQKLWSSVGHKPTLKDRVNAYGFAIEAAHGIKEQP
jgi:hypothetical protein